ncbi:hypothetical protein ACVWYD_001215 [Morganella morganii]
MFWSSKKKKITALNDQFVKARKQADHIFESIPDVEERAFYALAELSRSTKMPAHEAAKTPEGKKILLEVVLNRQYAFYLNELSIQIYGELKLLTDPDSIPLYDKNAWVDNVVIPATSGVIYSQLDPICTGLIESVDEYIK